LLSQFEEINKTKITVGITGAAYDNLLVEGKPINADGTTCETTGGVVVNYVVELEYHHISLILKSSDWTEYADKKIILCAYYIENGKVYYVGNEITELADFVIYNDLVE
jgi:hypothetical protein